MIFTHPGVWPRHVFVRRPLAPASGALGLILAVAVFTAVVDNLLFWAAVSDVVDFGLTRNPGFGVAVAIAMVAFFTLALAPFGIKYLLKPILITFVLLASVTSYFMDGYGIVVDDTMVRNVLETTTNEAGDLLTMALVVHVVLTGILPALVIGYWRIRWRPVFKQVGAWVMTVAVSLAICVGVTWWHYKDFALVVRSHPELRYLVNPTYPIYSIIEAVTQKARPDVPIRPLGTDASRSVPPDAARKIVIFVVGETARAANFGLDGYHRNTTPKLARDDVINFPHFYSCGTSTAVSVPCMFSRLDREDFDNFKARHTENLLDVLQHAGVAVLWRENNTGCKGVCARVPTRDMTQVDLPRLCGGERCFDTVLLHGLQDKIDATTGDMFIVLHQEGSHGPGYYKRYPKRFKRFTPVCATNTPQDCSRQSLINAYDNSILYTDYFLDQVIGLLRRNARQHGYDTAMFYVSDHGESLGEDGLYLHGFPYMLAPEAQKHVPAVAWFSPSFMRRMQTGRHCLTRRARKHHSQDNLFDTMLGLFNVHARIYESQNDLFRRCPLSR